MASSSKKCKISKQSNERDRLSELPDQLLVHILSLMPNIDAVRTVLLRRFGNLWTMIPSFVFDDGDILSSKGLGKSCKSNNEVSRNELKLDEGDILFSYFRNSLLFHKRPNIDQLRFTLYELDWLGTDSRRSRAALDEIKMWVKFAVQKEVKDLTLEFISHSVDCDSVLPRCVFTSGFLVELALVNVDIEHLGDVEMVALKTLSLSEIETSNEVFQKLISGCPSLHYLQIQDQYDLDELRITIPTIEELYLHVRPCLLDCPNVKVLNISLTSVHTVPDVVDVSSVREVVVCTPEYADQIDELVNLFYNVEVFRILDNHSTPLQLYHPNLPQTRWKHLHINSWLHDEEQLLSVCRMLRSSPLLEELELDDEYTGRLGHEDCRKLKVELPLPFAMPLLKTVTLQGCIVSCQVLLRVVGFLLKSAVVLEKIVVVPKKYELAAIDEVEFVKKLSGLFRALATAKVIFGLNVY